MWTKYLVLIVFLQAVCTQKVSENTENTSIKNNPITTKVDENNKIEKVITQQEITKIPQIKTTVEQHEKAENSGIEEPSFHQQINTVEDEFDFKYYWFLLVGSSIAIIGLIVYKSFRMRRSRAEVRYGKPTAQDEIEPLGSNSKWEDDSSSENEDEIFDINFLKNTRLQKHSDNV